MNRRIAIVGFSFLMLPLPAFGESASGQVEETLLIAEGRVLLTLNAQSGRRRRRRPKRVGGKYDVTEVQNAGSIQGQVLYKGELPKPKLIQVVKDHEVCDARSKSQELIKTNDAGQVREAVVYLADIKAGKAIPESERLPTLNQKTCTFEPHVQVLLAGRKFEIVNSDPVAHNANCVQNKVSLFNPLQPKKGMRSEFSIKRPGLVKFTCAVHNWMNAYAWVLWHPYFAITGEEGSFELTDVPPGEYELVVWQEYIGEARMKVTVSSGETSLVEFELTGED